MRLIAIIILSNVSIAKLTWLLRNASHRNASLLRLLTVAYVARLVCKLLFLPSLQKAHHVRLFEESFWKTKLWIPFLITSILLATLHEAFSMGCFAS